MQTLNKLFSNAWFMVCLTVFLLVAMMWGIKLSPEEYKGLVALTGLAASCLAGMRAAVL